MANKIVKYQLTNQVLQFQHGLEDGGYYPDHF